MEKYNSTDIIDSEKSPEHSEYSKGGVSSTLDLLKNEIRKKVKKKNISRDSHLTEKQAIDKIYQEFDRVTKESEVFVNAISRVQEKFIN